MSRHTRFHAGVALLGGPEARPARSPRAHRSSPRGFRASFRSYPAGVVGVGLVLLVGLVALVGPGLAPADPFAPVARPLQSPGPAAWLGSDDLGRDVLSGVLHGARVSLLVGLIAASTSALLGTAIGGCAGFFGGWVDDALMRLTEMVQVVPRFFLAVLVAALFGPSVWYLALLLGLTFWPTTARLLRAQVLGQRQREYVVAARALGLPPPRILLRHVLPNAVSVVVVSAALQVGGAILLEASLSFLGLGDRNLASWGGMLNNAQPFLRTAWWLSAFPGAALAVTVLGANLLADGLQAALDPRRRQART